MNYYPHHIGDYAQDTRHLSMLEHGAYRLLLDLYYSRESALPADVAACCRLVCARTEDERATVETVLREFFTLCADGWRQGRCDAEIERAASKRTKASESASKRWHAAVDANAMRTQCEGNAPNSQEPITNSQEEERERALPAKPTRSPEGSPPAARGSRIPEGFPDAPALAWCREERPDLQAEAVSEKFRDYWAGVPGQRGRKADWPATWRNFVRSERAPQQARASPADARRERESQFIRELTGRHHDDRTIIDAEPYFARIA
jgi:uncharacterized protein YdaU (DUF1376 family)